MLLQLHPSRRCALISMHCIEQPHDIKATFECARHRVFCGGVVIGVHRLLKYLLRGKCHPSAIVRRTSGRPIVVYALQTIAAIEIKQTRDEFRALQLRHITVRRVFKMRQVIVEPDRLPEFRRYASALKATEPDSLFVEARFVT